MSILSTPEHIQRTYHHGLYHEAFGEFLELADSAIDFAAGDNDYWRTADKNGQNFMRVDYGYGKHPPAGGDYLAADCREQIPGVADESFDVSVSSFFLQHLPQRDQLKVLTEMARVTKTAEQDSEQPSGLIMIFPLWRPKKIRELFAAYPDNLAHGYVTPLSEDRKLQFEYPTLIIRKTDDIKDDLPKILESVVKSDALKRTAALRTAMNAGKVATWAGKLDNRKKF